LVGLAKIWMIKEMSVKKYAEMELLLVKRFVIQESKKDAL